MKESKRYDDIIHLPHHQSSSRPHMSNYDRAAQFSPFAALKGYEEEIDEEKRLTDEKPELGEEAISALNTKLNELRTGNSRQVKIVYFKADERKEGGACLTCGGIVKRIDEIRQCLVLGDGTVIPFQDVIEIEILPM